MLSRAVYSFYIKLVSVWKRSTSVHVIGCPIVQYNGPTPNTLVAISCSSSSALPLAFAPGKGSGSDPGGKRFRAPQARLRTDSKPSGRPPGSNDSGRWAQAEAPRGIPFQPPPVAACSQARCPDSDGGGWVPD